MTTSTPKYRTRGRDFRSSSVCPAESEKISLSVFDRFSTLLQFFLVQVLTTQQHLDKVRQLEMTIMDLRVANSRLTEEYVESYISGSYHFIRTSIRDLQLQEFEEKVVALETNLHNLSQPLGALARLKEENVRFFSLCDLFKFLFSFSPSSSHTFRLL